MHAQPATNLSNSHEEFTLRFKSRFRQDLARHASAPEAFERAWAAALKEWPLPEDAQAAIYWELIGWGRSYELFTNRRTATLARRAPILH
jgi:hypothetical protein